MSTLICGSFAYDNITEFNDQFKNHILPDQLDILNVCFLVPSLRREFGGVAGNIAYNLKMIGGKPIPMGTVGEDFEPYRRWINKHNIESDYVSMVSGAMTAQAFITTDNDGNQITVFHPGAMEYSMRNSLEDVVGTKLAIISPDGKDGMIYHAEQAHKLSIPFIFDPGQGLPMFEGKELERFIEIASWITVNAYEAEMLQSKTGLSLEEIAGKVDALIVTEGGNGSKILTEGQCIIIPSAVPSQAVDPTGCGDAYRAGILYGIEHKLSWEVTGRVASLLGAIKIEKEGTQNHLIDRHDFERRYEIEFGSVLEW
jgi:adenosine kinase